MKKTECMVALITAMTPDLSIDFKAMDKIIERLIAQDCDGFIVCGTTGEACTLSLEEKLILLDHVLFKTAGRVPVWMGCGCADTWETLKLIRLVNTRNVNGILLVTPYYIRPDQKGIMAHFSLCASVSGHPVMLYHVPKRCGCRLNTETVLKLVQERKNIVALKQASDDFGMIRRLKEETELRIYSGEDGHFLEGLQAGADGIISVVGHLCMPLLKQIARSWQEGIRNQGADLKLKNISKQLFKVSSPSDVKQALSEMDLCEPYVRMPLMMLSEKQKWELREEMKIWNITES